MAVRKTYDAGLLQLMGLFERITRASLKDCFSDDVQDRLVFVVREGSLWKALGPKGANVKKLEKATNRKIKIVEFNPERTQFIKNMVFPLRLKDIREDGETVTLVGEDTKTKGLLIGRNASNLRNLERLVRRFFSIDEIKVI